MNVNQWIDVKKKTPAEGSCPSNWIADFREQRFGGFSEHRDGRGPDTRRALRQAHIKSDKDLWERPTGSLKSRLNI